MTNMRIAGTDYLNKIIAISKMQPGKWYIVREYEHNTVFVGAVGVAVDKGHGSHGTIMLITPDAEVFSHPDFFVEEISQVQITYEV